MTKYIRTFFNGYDVVAEFEDDGHRFVMTEFNLKERIRNKSNQNLNVSAEKKGLAFIRVHDKYKPPKK